MLEAETFVCGQCYEDLGDEDIVRHTHALFGEICDSCNQDNLADREDDREDDLRCLSMSR